MIEVTEAVASGLSLLGLSAAFGALGVAIAIFQKQKADQDSANVETKAHLKRLTTTTGEINAKLNSAASVAESDEERAAAGDDVEDAAKDSDAMQRGKPMKVDGRWGHFLARESVPLSVISDLVWGWRREGIGRDRTWTVENLVGAYRADGRGNFPWLLYFVATDGGEQIWRLYRGGKAKSEPTVRDVSDEHETPSVVKVSTGV